MSIVQEVEMLRQEIANGPPLFPPPNDNAEELSKQFKRKNTRSKKLVNCRMLVCYFIRNQTQQTYRKYVINKVAGELWRTTTRNNKLAYKNLCNQINSIINQ
ncbi:hypothetical protein RhiirA5_412623 [Rhizophagus irregularis]|jgi:hypothetical protein|uniref:MATA-HMG n=3 Tax=Rhizophagus irregularis TaxID=588596 RepID=A0A2I1DZG5_9GLOM|nr:hypothetical protein GLOIN_2v1768491 [Rhizophagus irregularis DAOM 181602=DAOM 197198]EXX59002.1 hypothetical protein RirG_192720 [Rhizophagus irregularis DAOM 197198w]PKC11789.1 hypothetical protein RhiirA5_412623 [Rhizophagus irregularis]RGB41643.1 hypothetical protein C1646_751937 [Rhizophagus diaphanus] [Rhizophagus sp. MUCL 43196]PKC73481.1 hypothetical protein RhiirA1_451115 [Rhizophagus irregularis]PKY15267.1 hypothetical protein RhiirB3_427436 [Rhizophagus irregularis]|eukprot:XP_025183665.1 hypothetical protein GLOIN_2v1768491 [Rhizophagus irregularis DAOM 181602=DAOM 197198]